MIRCPTCWKEISLKFPDVQYNDWLKLMHYFEHELNEEEITQATYENMVDALMAVKPYLPQNETKEAPNETDG